MSLRYHHGDLRNALVHAGIAVLGAEGVEGISLRAVARAAGVTHSAPYHHFVDKAALLTAVAEEGFRILTAKQETLPVDVPAREALHAMALGYTRFALEMPHLFRLMFGEALGERAIHSVLYASAKRSFELLVAIVARGQAAGELRAGDPAVAAEAVWALAHGWTVLVLDRQTPSVADKSDLDTATRRILDSLVDGLAEERGLGR